jgi:cytochrome c oxidase subunit IV
MKSIGMVLVWFYLAAATVIEVYLFYSFTGSSFVNYAISVLALSKGVFIFAFYMHIRYEQRSLKVFSIIPLFFMLALLFGMFASIGH